AVLAALVDAITSTMTLPIVAALSRESYATLAKLAGQATAPHPNTEYMLCAVGCITRVAKILGPGTAEVAYYFESGDRGGNRFVAGLQPLLEKTDFGARNRIHSVQVADKRVEAGLQAADVLAHVVTTAHRKQQRPGPALQPILDAVHPQLVTFMD